MRYSITCNLRFIKELEKYAFQWEKLNFGHIRKGPEYLSQLFDVLPKQTICKMKALQVYKFTFNIDFVMKRKLHFSVTRNDFGHVPIYLWVTLFLRVRY